MRTLRTAPLAASAVSLVLVALAAGGPLACKKPAPPTTTQQTAVAPETPVAAPNGLAVEAVVRSPDAILESLRAVTPLVPDKAGPLLAEAMHLPRELGADLDGTKPAYFVEAITGVAPASFVFVVALRDAAHAQGVLAKGAFQKSDDAATGTTIYQGTATPKNQVIGVRKGYLLAASTADALTALAPYATRTMPTRPLPADDVAVTIPQSALRTVIKEQIRALLEASAAHRKDMLAKAKAGGLKVGGLDAVAGYSAKQNARFVDWLSDAGDAHLTLSTQAGAIALRAEMGVPDPGSSLGKQVAGWPLGDAADALTTPAGAVLAFSGRSSDAARAEGSHDLLEMLAETFPDDVGAVEQAKLGVFLAAWDAARGARTAGALVYESPKKIGASLRLEAKDAPALGKLIDAALHGIFAIKGVASGLEKQGIAAPTWSTEKLAGVDATVMHVNLPRPPGDKPRPGGPDGAELIFAPVGGDVVVAAGVGARELLADAIAAKSDPARALGANAPLATRVTELGSALAGAAVVMPTRVMPMVQGATVTSPPPASDALVLAIGKGPSSVWVTLGASKPAVEALARMAMSGALGGGGKSPIGP